MKKRSINVNEYANVITDALSRGVLMTTKQGDKINSMFIGWGHIGRIWERSVFVAYVRRCRFTRELLDQTGEFTVNVPVNGMDRKTFAVCGTKSGRDTDKLREAGLTPVPAERIGVPALKELPLTLECRVIYRQEQQASGLSEDIRRQFYTVETDEHIAYYAQILAAYVLEE